VTEGHDGAKELVALWLAAWPKLQIFDDPANPDSALIQAMYAYEYSKSLHFLGLDWKDNPEWLYEDLPAPARLWLHDGDFCDNMANSAERIARELMAGYPKVRRMCDDMNLVLAGRRIGNQFEIDPADEVACALDTLLPLNRRATEPLDCLEVWLEDEDILMLYSPLYDGIENAPTIRGYMHPESWFVPYSD
jgi:hypothetical protein